MSRADRDRRYAQSEKGLARHRRYNASAKGHARYERYDVELKPPGCDICARYENKHPSRPGLYLSCKRGRARRRESMRRLERRIGDKEDMLAEIRSVFDLIEDGDLESIKAYLARPFP